MLRNRIWLPVTFVLPVMVWGQAHLRKAKIGDLLTPFTLPEIQGASFSFQGNLERPTVFAFVVAHQALSDHVMSSLDEIVSQLAKDGHPLDLVAIACGKEGKVYFQDKRKALGFDRPILLDEGFQIWGRLGIVAAPTVIVLDPKGRIAGSQAGYAYDFRKTMRLRLLQVLGLIRASDIETAPFVPSKAQDPAVDRARSHLKIAERLVAQGQVDLALKEARQAAELQPESCPVLIQLGLLLCRAGQSEDALAVAERIKSARRVEIARAKLIAGWAQREQGDEAKAESLLLEAVRLEPNSVRALYELGKLYRQQGLPAKAMAAFERALSLHFQDKPLAEKSDE